MSTEQTNKPLTFEQRIEHLSFSLDNVQKTIRFVDTKVAGGLTYTTLLIGFAVSRPVLADQLKSCRFAHWHWVLWMLLSLLALSFALVLVFAALTLIPRRSSKITGRLWVLFPLRSNDLGGIHLRDKLAQKAAELSEDIVISEFCDQLAVNGEIMTTKLNWCKHMFEAILGLVVLAFVLGITSLLLFTCVG